MVTDRNHVQSKSFRDGDLEQLNAEGEGPLKLRGRRERRFDGRHEPVRIVRHLLRHLSPFKDRIVAEPGIAFDELRLRLPELGFQFL